MRCPKCDGEIKKKKRWGIITYTCIECDYTWYEKKNAKCPVCNSKKIGFKKIWGDEYQICFNCRNKVKIEKEKQYYYEGDIPLHKAGLLEEMSARLT